MAKSKHLTITVSGLTKSGKTTLLYFLKNLLKENKFDVSHELNLDFKDEAEFDKIMSNKTSEIIELLKADTKITIREISENKK